MEVNVGLLRSNFEEVVSQRAPVLFNDSDVAFWFAHALLLKSQNATLRTQSGKQKFDLIISWPETPHCYCMFRNVREGWPAGGFRTERKKLTEGQTAGGSSFFFLTCRGEYPEQIEKLKELFEDDGVTTFIAPQAGG